MLLGTAAVFGRWKSTAPSGGSQAHPVGRTISIISTSQQVPHIGREGVHYVGDQTLSLYVEAHIVEDLDKGVGGERSRRDRRPHRETVPKKV